MRDVYKVGKTLGTGGGFGWLADSMQGRQQEAKREAGKGRQAAFGAAFPLHAWLA